jgi:hypothetical protein
LRPEKGFLSSAEVALPVCTLSAALLGQYPGNLTIKTTNFLLPSIPATTYSKFSHPEDEGSMFGETSEQAHYITLCKTSANYHMNFPQ